MWRKGAALVALMTPQTAAFIRAPSRLSTCPDLLSRQSRGSMMRMSLSPVEVTSLTAAALDNLSLNGDFFSQLADNANSAAQAMADGVSNAKQGIAPEQLQQMFDSVGAALPSITDSVKGLAGSASNLVDSIKNGDIQSLGETGSSVSGFLSSKLAAANGLFGEETTKALSEANRALGPILEPAKPYIDQLGSQLSIVKDAGQKVLGEVLKDETIILQKASPLLSKYGTPRNVFNAENLAVLPLWGSVILAPNNRLVKAFWSSYFPIIIGALAYVWLTYLAFNDPVSLEGFAGMSDLSVLTKGFSSETSTAVAWAHFIAQDLFVGRWIYLDGQRNNVWTSHSLLLAFLFGPSGILSHLLTRGVVRVVRWDVKDIMDAGGSNLVASAAEQQAGQALKDAEKQLKKAESKASSTLSKARREADGTLAKAREKADKILRRAEAEAAQLLNEAFDEAESSKPKKSVKVTERDEGRLAGAGQQETRGTEVSG